MDRCRTAAERLEVAVAGGYSDNGLCHGESGRALALAVLGWTLDDQQLVERATKTFCRPKRRYNDDDVGLMTGSPGVVLAHLAVTGKAAPPIAFVRSALAAGDRLAGRRA